jgi:hypothetical protein
MMAMFGLIVCEFELSDFFIFLYKFFGLATVSAPGDIRLSDVDKKKII